MDINKVTTAMIDYYQGQPKRIQHFLKVHAYAKLIGEQEGLDKEILDILEVAALTHDIGIKISEEKYNSSAGKYQEVEEYGMEPFINQCKESVWKYKGMWEDFSDTVGFWADMDDPYVTYDDNYIESEWWALKEIWNKDLLYKGFKIVP